MLLFFFPLLCSEKLGQSCTSWGKLKLQKAWFYSPPFYSYIGFFLIKSHIVMKFTKTILGLRLGSSVTECLLSIHKALGSWVQYPASWENTTTVTIKTHTLLSTILIFSPKECCKRCRILQNSKICVHFCFTF